MISAASTIKEHVKTRYGAIAAQHILPVKQGNSRCCGPVECGGSSSNMNMVETLYHQGELAGLPDTVTLASLGCGNPTAIAGLKPGEVVLDLGSGGGIDCFLAAKAVGPDGSVIGVDMTENMLELANKNKAKLGLTNVEFRRGEIEALPVENGTVDLIISNCVINLSPDKEAVFREAFRVLRPGGRLAVSDIVTVGDFPAEVRANLAAWAECLTGAIDQSLYIEYMGRAGFVDITVESRTPYGPEQLDLGDGSTIPEDVHIYSAHFVAYKPGE
jgi:SAM-dependent methyltransferase